MQDEIRPAGIVPPTRFEVSEETAVTVARSAIVAASRCSSLDAGSTGFWSNSDWLPFGRRRSVALAVYFFSFESVTAIVAAGTITSARTTMSERRLRTRAML